MKEIDGAKWALGAIESGKQGDRWCCQTTALIVDPEKLWRSLAAALAKGRAR